MKLPSLSKSSDCQTISDETQIPCNICLYVATCEEELNWHMDYEHEITTDLYFETEFLCDICAKFCRTKADLTSHMKQHEESSIIAHNKIKDLEQKLSETKVDLKEASENAFMLEITLYNEKSQVKTLKKKLENMPNHCETCDDAQRNVNNLELHIPEHTDDSEPSTSKCGMCDYKSDDENYLQLQTNSKHTNLVLFYM